MELTIQELIEHEKLLAEEFSKIKGEDAEAVEICVKNHTNYAKWLEELVRLRDKQNVTKQIEEVAENICDNFCKYRETCDDNAECEWIRGGNRCPLDKLL